VDRSWQLSEAFYEFDGTGNVDVVLRRSQPSAERAEIEITAIIHLRSVWRPIPGETVVKRTQINGTVTYSISSGNPSRHAQAAPAVDIDERFFR